MNFIYCQTVLVVEAHYHRIERSRSLDFIVQCVNVGGCVRDTSTNWFSSHANAVPVCDQDAMTRVKQCEII